MANREWNPKSFFRHLTPDALAVLLEWAAVELTLDGDGPVCEQVYRGWKALPEAERVAIETKLLPVNDLCGNSLFFRGTIELRYFNGTLHAGEVKAYVQLALAMAAPTVATAQDKPRAPMAPSNPANTPSRPYSMATIAERRLVLAPSVR